MSLTGSRAYGFLASASPLPLPPPPPPPQQLPLDSDNEGTPRVRKKKTDKKTDVYEVYPFKLKEKPTVQEVYNAFDAERNGISIEYNADNINLTLLNQTRKTGFVLPKGVSSKREHRDTVNSKFNDGFFTNAKAASMLEWGWRQAETKDIRKGVTGLLILDDDPEMKVEVTEGFHGIYFPVTPTAGWTKYGYTFKETGKKDSQPLELLDKDRPRKWNFYLRTTPVPFTPRVPRGARGGSKKRKVKKGRKTRKMRRKA